MKTINCAPNITNFTKSFKSIGYNHYTAILDIIDNSISAGASNIWVDYFKEKNGGYKISITDNGIGMSSIELLEAMRIASSDPTAARENNDLGKFGLGLKLASFSQTDKFSVISKTKYTEKESLTWDLDFVRKENKWLLKKEDIEFTKPLRHGTEVILFNVFSDKTIDVNNIISKLRTHIAVVYFFQKDTSFFMNDTQISKIDPFFNSSLASNHSALENVQFHQSTLGIQSHQIPHERKMKPPEKRLHKEMLEIGMGPGLYIFRKKRLISWSGWGGLEKNLQINNLYKLAIFCQDDSDQLFNIEVKKSQVSISDYRLRNLLKKYISNFMEIARKPYKKRASLSMRDLSDIWTLEKNSNGKVIFRLNKNSQLLETFLKGNLKLNEFLNLLEETIPYESLMYYLNMNKINIDLVNNNRLESAKKLLYIGLLTQNEFNILKKKYES